jgi:anthranilate/para-aminobenzoate synthase component I
LLSEEERSRQVRKSAPRLRDGVNVFLKSVFFGFFHSLLCFQLSDLSSWTCLDIRTATRLTIGTVWRLLGTDLTVLFEAIDLAQKRDPERRDILLYLPDSVYVIDANKRDAWHVTYDFCFDRKSTQGMPREEGLEDYFKKYEDGQPFEKRDTTPEGELFTHGVELAKREFAVRNLFEAVLSQTLREKRSDETPPSTMFRRLRKRNPSPYGFFIINLGEQEYLVGASPEMFVRCESIPENDFRPDALTSCRNLSDFRNSR